FDPHHPFSAWPWLRLVTALFMHADWLHLVGNVLFLVIFGFSAERALGAQRFRWLFLLGRAFANVVGALTLSGATAPIVGCSGAVSAVVGAYLALFPRAHLGLVLPLGFYFEFVRVPAWLMIGMWVLLQLLFTWAGPGFGTVVWWAHIAGFTFGIAFALISRGAVARRLLVLPPEVPPRVTAGRHASRARRTRDGIASRSRWTSNAGSGVDRLRIAPAPARPSALRSRSADAWCVRGNLPACRRAKHRRGRCV